MASVLSNVGGGVPFFRRQQARIQSERVANEEIEPVVSVASSDDEEGAFVNNASDDHSNNPETEIDIEQGRRPSNLSTSATEHRTEDESNNTTEGDDSSSEGSHETTGLRRFNARNSMTLAELEEERELARRRSSACVLFALFVLFRLWLLALESGDFGLLLLCLVGTSWTARWIRYNREQEEELDRRIANYIENSENGNNNTVDRNDLRMLSFQAQLALAIMESQRQMMEGGYGHPDGANSTPGVSEEARSKWEQFSYKAEHHKELSKKGQYGSVALEDNLKAASGEDEPHCAICLGEYEEKEELTKLPCNHVYHQECIDSWCTNHTRCPLCNLELEIGAGDSV